MLFKISEEKTASKDAQDTLEISTELALGGQAIIEGVMMRSPDRVAMAARKASGEIAVRTYPYIPITRRNKFIGAPVIRGGIGLVESLRIGLDALNWSAEMASKEPSAPQSSASKAKDKIIMTLTMIFGLIVAMALFMYFPLWVGRWIAGGEADQSASRQIIVNVVAGGIRVTLLLCYLWFISLMKDIRRVFQYHGSEHKTIFAFETGPDLNVDRVQKQTRFHPRCGTSFLIILALLAVLFFVIVDSLVVTFIGNYPNIWIRVLVHLALVPVLAGISYEFLRFSARHTDNKLVWALIQPGLWLQRITTQEPDRSMCEVAVTALETALGKSTTVVAPESEPKPAEA